MRFLFGTRCGFSKKVAAALTGTGVEYGTFDILGDEDIRSGLKEYSDWPTYPQLYVGVGPDSYYSPRHGQACRTLVF